MDHIYFEDKENTYWNFYAGIRISLLGVETIEEYPFEVDINSGESTSFLSNKEVLKLTIFLMNYCSEKGLISTCTL